MNVHFQKSAVIFMLTLLAFTACKKDDAKKQAEADEKTITQYIADNKLTATATGSGLYYVVTTPGTGAQPTINSNVTVNYKGYLTNKSVFDQSSSAGITFPLSNVIKGWQEGIPLFKKGGKGILLIPSALGYGARPQANIPANSVLIFDINLINVQ